MRHRSKPRSPEAQLSRMERRWPLLKPNMMSGGQVLQWLGPLRGFQMEYQIAICWDWQSPDSCPLAFVLRPEIRPRKGERYIDIPHLMFNEKAPEDSALCLFDPDTGEWNGTMWIADSTVPWTSEWLHHYELWHLDGVWRGKSAPGPISIGAGLAQGSGAS